MTEQLKALAEAASNPATRTTGDFIAYIESVTPERILALIAENERLAHSRKDAGAVLWSVTNNGQHVGNSFKTEIEANLKMEELLRSYPNDKRTVVALFTHPPEADKLLQQALEALERATGYLWAGTMDECNQDAVADVRLHKKTITAIRTYLEGKK